MKTSASLNKNLRPLIQLPKLTTGKVLSIAGFTIICLFVFLIYKAGSYRIKVDTLRSQTDTRLIIHQPDTIEIIMLAAENDEISIPEKRYLIDEDKLRGIAYSTHSRYGSSLAIKYNPPNEFIKTLYVYNLTFEEWTEAFNQLEGPKFERSSDD